MIALRKVGAVFGAALLATGLGLAPSSPASAAATAPSLSDFRLRSATPDGAELQARVNKLDSVLPKLGVQNILLQANRTGAWTSGATNCPGASTKADVFINKTMPPGRRFCWDASDANTLGGAYEWAPQGVTTVADAQADELWGTKQATLVSWYDNTADPEKGVRISFIDTATNQYQHVLLAYPYLGPGEVPTWESVTTTQSGDHGSLHAGGIVWFGNYLYVADTKQGFRVFDMRYIFDLKAAEVDGLADLSKADANGLSGGKYTSFGYRYVMPQVDWLVSDFGDNTGATGVCAASGTPKFSFLSLDRSASSPRLISGEYCKSTDPNKMGRVAEWPLNSSTGLLQRNASNKVDAVAVHRLPASYIQGAVSYNGKWYLSQTGGNVGNNAGLLEATSTGGVLSVTKARWAGTGAEDLSIWGSKSEIWTVTEFAGRRVVYTCPFNATAAGTICGPGASIYQAS